MRLAALTLQHFRNVPLAQLRFEGRQQFFVGANGQGKTNLLEAAGFLTALRSFRTTEARSLIAHGQPEAALSAEVEHERVGATRIIVKLRPGAKELWLDATRVTRMSDYLGRFPAVVFSSQDIQLVRGSPALRRRWLDLALAAMDADYLQALQGYTRALADRNRLLKQPGGGAPAELEAFERPLAECAVRIVTRRRAGLAALAALVRMQAARIAAPEDGAGAGGGVGEGQSLADALDVIYAPKFDAADVGAWRERYASDRERARDRALGSTHTGPHRDELEFTHAGRPVREFASEGQQRTLVLALRLAEVAWFHERSGVRPVVLADDVLGELDAGRRERFWAAIDPAAQVIATGTALPAAGLGEWQVFRVEQGAFTAAVGQGGPE